MRAIVAWLVGIWEKDVESIHVDHREQHHLLPSKLRIAKLSLVKITFSWTNHIKTFNFNGTLIFQIPYFVLPN